ncbi:hypothetical protein B0H14DRAFT_2789028 [Mycena olivaceomarginata]|nr:hypothetical protein B0H14DRAFT_2789028 [Mycena olivaceomarginata]
MSGRTLRNGKIYTEFVEDAFVLDHFRLRDVMIARQTGPQDESDCDDADLKENSNWDADGPALTRVWKERGVLAMARTRWQPPETRLPTGPLPVSTAATSSSNRFDVRKAKKKGLCHAARQLKPIAQLRTCQSTPIRVNFKMVSHPAVTSTGWMGLREPAAEFKPEAREYSFDEARQIPGMVVLDCQGKPGPLVDADGYVFALFGAQPRDPGWAEDVVELAAKLMEEAAANMYDHIFSGVYYGTPKEEKRSRAGPTPSRRGMHDAERFGSSMGGGQQFPMPCFQTALRTIVLVGLLAQKPFQRIAGFTNSLFRCYAPALHEYYPDTMNKLHNWNRYLKRNFSANTSVFAAATFNFGPWTVTFPHLDFANLAWGWCSITLLGDFDPDKGGHLILWDLKLIIRFPPGSTIFIPSALIRHSNTSIQAHEKQFSFTQYTAAAVTAAGIFRFIDNSFKSQEEVDAMEMSVEEKAARLEARKARWVDGLKMYQKYDLP